MVEVISFGEALIDMIGERGRGLNGTKKFEKHFGGAPANYAIAVRRLGVHSALLTRISDDGFGDFLMGVLSKNKVDTSMIVRTKKKTTLAFVSLNARGVPEFSFYRNDTADLDVRESDVREKYFKGVKIFHFCSLSLVEDPVRSALFKALTLARRHGVLVSFDPNLRKDLMRRDTMKYVRKAMKYANVVIPSEEELKEITMEKTLRAALKKFKEKRIIVTRGPRGSVMYHNGKIVSFPAFNVNVVDTTGAGDAFSAGVSVGLLRGLDGAELLKFASAVAALSIQRKGAISSLPTRREVERFLLNVKI